MNDSVAYSPTQYFTVEVRGTNNVLWERLLFTAPGFPPINDWTTRSFSLSRYLGETIRLVWKQEYYCYKLNSYLDNVALQVTSAVPTVFDVYLGTNAIPGPAEFRATTSSPSWNAIALQPGTAYFWKVSAKRGGAEISSPTWQFTTAASPGIDHFKWSAIATQQFVGEPFYVSLTAQGLTNNTISTFSEPTRITGSLMSGRRQLFYYDFEDGNFSGWTTGSSSYSQFVTTQTAASGRYSLSLVGGAQTHVDGLKYAFPRFSMRPDRVNFAVRASATDKAGGFLAIGNDGGSYGVGVMFYMGPSGRMGIYERGTGFHGTNYAAQQWYRVSLVFDWTRKRIGCLINGQTVATDVPFQNSFLDDVASLHLYNFDYTQVWYDDIEIIDGDRTLPLLVGPAEVSGFLNGIWTGQITLQEPATKMWLSATDTSGHRGFSGEFDVDSSADSDGDGLPDAWELRYFGSLNANPNEDPDRDGLTNLREFQAGTLPNAALSTLRITAVEVSGGLVRLCFNSVAGKMYQFERTGALDAGAWQLLGSAMLGDGTTLQFVDADGTNLPARFYRIRLVR